MKEAIETVVSRRNPQIDPHLSIWGWEIPVYLFLGGLVAGLLVLSGIFFGFASINMAIASAMTAEIMPKGQMGRWIGIVSLIRGLFSIPAPILGGLIWDHVGPQYVFMAAIAIDLFLRLPLLASVRETLHLHVDESEPDQTEM